MVRIHEVIEKSNEYGTPIDQTNSSKWCEVSVEKSISACCLHMDWLRYRKIVGKIDSLGEDDVS